jgi:hypothetical protein
MGYPLKRRDCCSTIEKTATEQKRRNRAKQSLQNELGRCHPQRDGCSAWVGFPKNLLLAFGNNGGD